MDTTTEKNQAAEAAAEIIRDATIIGIGSGSTVDCFINVLKKTKHTLEGVVAASTTTAKQLKALSIPVYDLNSVGELHFYVDGADEINSAKQMIKGGGGALTREKIIATVAKKFICIIDESKKVDMLGQFPIAIEVIPMARSYVARQVVRLGGDPVYREGFVTDNGNQIIDVYNFKMLDPKALETQLKTIVGVVENGIFATRTADIVLMGTAKGVQKF